MSGVEAVGLVLSILPLVINGLESYAEGVSTIKVMFKYRSELQSLSRLLRVEYEMLRTTMEHLLSDCVDDQTLTALLDDMGGKLWSDNSVEAALRRKLQRSYNIFFETVHSMNKSMKAFRERLKLGKDGSMPASFDDASSFKDAYRRFRFSLKKAEYKDLIEQIRLDNTSLFKLTDRSLALEPARKSLKQIPRFDKIRGHAHSMFESLQKGLYGSCTAPHRASVCMKSVEETDTLVGPTDESDFIFRVVLYHEPATPQPVQPPWSIEEAEVRLLESKLIGSGLSCPTQINKPLPYVGKGKKGVKFVDSTQADNLPKALNADQQETLKEIRDLCASIERLRAIQCGICLGYLLDAATARRHALYRPQQPIVKHNSFTSVSLGTILTGQHQLTVAESRQLAKSVAVGVLRLHDTPWLREQWTLHDIVVFKQTDGKILANHPFASADLQIANQAQIPASQRAPSIRNHTLFALGVVLIELCMGKPFDELREPGELNADGTKYAMSDCMTATRLLDPVYDKAGARYGDAVRRCIYCDFDQRKFSLQDDAFRKAVYENVVAVLEEDVRQFFNL